MNIIKTNSAYVVSHNGLGDNITNIGAINFLLKYYNKIYFLCKDIYKNNVELLFINKLVVVISFNHMNEFNEIADIISKISNTDIFISGNCFNHLKYYTKITNNDLLKYKKNNKNYSISYKFIEDFYNDYNLDISVYYEYFDISSSENSLNYYNKISKYKIIFMHTKSSSNEINLNNIINLYINNDEYLIICANLNVYNTNSIKYNIANEYVNIKIQYYIDIIKNAHIIHVIDSCFSCIVIPLLGTNRLKAIETQIHTR